MNYFVIFNGIMYCAAASWSTAQGNYLWASVWLSYGISAFILAVLEGHS